jgi:hypothetical protein
MTVAVLQHMPLQDGGIHVDMEGSGVAYYCHRRPGTPCNSEQCIIEYERTIVALYAGRIAQYASLPGIDYRDYPESWKSDWTIAAELLCELSPLVQGVTESSLYVRAQELILRNWSTIESLTSALWERPIVQMPRSEFEKGWSQGRKRQEKVLSRSDVQEFFARLRITCLLWPDCCGE